MLERLLRHEADVAVMAKSVSDPRLHAVRLRTDRLVLFVPARHALARRGRVPLAALAGQELVLRERGSITREVLEQAMAAADIQPGAIVEVQTREGVREAVAAGFGIGAVFASELGEDRRFRRILVTRYRSRRRRICRLPAGAPPRGAGAGLHGRGGATGVLSVCNKIVKKLSSLASEA